MLKKVVGYGKRCMEKVSGAYQSVALAVVAVVGAVSLNNSANAADIIPDIGIDWAEIAAEGATMVGTVLVAGVGVIIAIALFKMAARFISNAFSGRV